MVVPSYVRTPLDALAYVIECGFLSSRGQVPGVIIQSVSPDVRALLQRLTSDDAQRLRCWLHDQPHRRGRYNWVFHTERDRVHYLGYFNGYRSVSAR